MKQNKEKKELSGLSSRFLLAIEIVGYTNSRIIKEMDVLSPPILNHIKTGRNDPSTKIITAFLKKFPAIDARWLITGAGQPEADTAGMDRAIENMDYTQILHRIPPDEIVTYIHHYRKTRNINEDTIFRGLLEEYIQDQVMEGLKALQEKVERIEKKLK